MASTITPNMGLIVPGVGTEPGPTWANDLNASLGILDQHSHVPGQGVQITPAGININTNLPINGNNLTSVKTVNFQALSSTLAGTAPNLGCIYVAGNELVYNDEAGNVVPITNNGSVNAGSGSITGLPSGTASASYSSGSGTFVWRSATNTGANMDGASFIFREQVANANGVTVSSPTSLAASYQMFWPAALPASQKFMTLDSAGNISAPWIVDNSTIEVSANTVQVKNLGITTAKIANNAVTRGKLAAVGQQVSSSCGAFATSSTSATNITNLSVTLTTTGRPVVLLIQSDGLGSSSYFQLTNGSGIATASLTIYINRDVTLISQQILFDNTVNNAQVAIPGSSVSHIDTPIAGTYLYTIQMSVGNASSTGIANNLVLFAYEL